MGSGQGWRRREDRQGRRAGEAMGRGGGPGEMVKGGGGQEGGQGRRCSAGSSAGRGGGAPHDRSQAAAGLERGGGDQGRRHVLRGAVAGRGGAAPQARRRAGEAAVTRTNLRWWRRDPSGTDGSPGEGGAEYGGGGSGRHRRRRWMEWRRWMERRQRLEASGCWASRGRRGSLGGGGRG